MGIFAAGGGSTFREAVEGGRPVVLPDRVGVGLRAFPVGGRPTLLAAEGRQAYPGAA